MYLLTIFLFGCVVNSGAGDQTFSAIINGELHYDYGKPVTHEEITLTSHAQNYDTGGVAHAESFPVYGGNSASN